MNLFTDTSSVEEAGLLERRVCPLVEPQIREEQCGFLALVERWTIYLSC